MLIRPDGLDHLIALAALEMLVGLYYLGRLERGASRQPRAARILSARIGPSARRLRRMDG